MLIKLLYSLYMHVISSSLKRYLNSEGNEIRSIYLLKNGNRDTYTNLHTLKLQINYIIVLCDRQTDRELYYYNID